MYFHWIDWLIVIAVVVIFMWYAYRTKAQTKSVADFLVANRCAGRYVLGVAEGMASLGAISIISIFQMYYKAGFASTWIAAIGLPISAIITLSGWVLYRYRETRVMTLGQLLEVRYSKRFRIFAALVCFFSGVVNFGIFPAVGANFFINYCGLSESVAFLGFSVPTFPVLSLSLVLIALYFTLVGGQIAVIVSDFLQGMFCNLVLFAILIFLLVKFGLGEVFDGLMYSAEEQSMVNPFKTAKTDGFTPWYFVILYFQQFYTRLAFQGNQGYNSSAISAHEAKMGAVVGILRSWAFMITLTLLPLVVYMIMHHPNYADQASHINGMLAGIGNDQVRDQMLAPVAMTTFIPIGLLGAFAAVMFTAFVTTNDTYLHSWGSILIQDVIAPLRKKELSTKEHLRYLRFSVIGVALFVYLFSLFFRQTTHIALFMLITGAIWIGGAGSIIIGGLYWKRGTTAGAYCALVIGAVISLAGIVLDQVWKSRYGVNFPVDAKWIAVISYLCSIAIYVAISLLTCREPFNLNRMLHREEKPEPDGKEALVEKKPLYQKIKLGLGITDEFTWVDKLSYIVVYGHNMGIFAVFLIITPIAFITGFSDQAWSNTHKYIFMANLIMAFFLAAWVTIGGFYDLGKMFKRLKSSERNYADDGAVVDHHNRGEEQADSLTLNKDQ